MEKMQEAKSGDLVKLEKKGDSISGVLLSVEESKMYKGTYLLKIKNPADNMSKSVFVSNIVYDKILSNQIEPGNQIMIEYQGEVVSKKSGRSYKDYKVFFSKEK